MLQSKSYATGKCFERRLYLSAGRQVSQDRTTVTQQDVVAEHEDEDSGRLGHPDLDICHILDCLLWT